MSQLMITKQLRNARYFLCISWETWRIGICKALYTALCNVRIGAFQSVNQYFVHLRMDNVIAIYETDVLSSGGIQTSISSRGGTPILLMDYHNSLIGLLIGIANRSASICRSIVHKYQFKVCKGLSQNAINATNEILLNVIYRNDNTKFHWSTTRFRYNCLFLALQ